MAGKLAHEIRQTKPFALREDEAYLNLLRTSDLLWQQVVEGLRPYQLSPNQYNVLRILRGAGTEGLACSQIGERMITRDPDVTRLLDRLEGRGLLRRERSQEDRRVVVTRITKDGLALLAQLDGPVECLGRKQFAHLTREQLDQLIELLEIVREQPK